MKRRDRQAEKGARVAWSSLRLLAGAVDMVIPASLTFLACYVSGRPDTSQLPPRYWNHLDYMVEVINCCPMQTLIPAVVFTVFYLVVVIAFGATIGNTPFSRLAGLRILRSDGRRAGVLRLFFWAISGVVLTVTAFAAPLWAFVDPERRMLHDILAGVVVVFGRSDTVEARPAPETGPDAEPETEPPSGPVAFGSREDDSPVASERPWYLQGRNP